MQDFFKYVSKKFSHNFVNYITKVDRPKISKFKMLFTLGNKRNEGVIHFMQRYFLIYHIKNKLIDLFMHNGPIMLI